MRGDRRAGVVPAVRAPAPELVAGAGGAGGGPGLAGAGAERAATGSGRIRAAGGRGGPERGAGGGDAATAGDTGTGERHAAFVIPGARETEDGRLPQDFRAAAAVASRRGCTDPTRLMAGRWGGSPRT